MKQIITQHGWGLNKYFWDDYKVDFLNNNWHWQDNERGYFSAKNYQAKWIKSESKKQIRMTLCHSFGFHLMQKKILKEATHIVLINSFNISLGSSFIIFASILFRDLKIKFLLLLTGRKLLKELIRTI